MINKQVEVTLTPEAVYNLAYAECTLEDFDMAINVAEHFDKMHDNDIDKVGLYMLKLATVWNAGRIIGIKQERDRRKANR